MNIRLAVYVAIMAACSFPFSRECSAQVAGGGRGKGAKAERRAEFERRIVAEVRRLKAESPNRYVENADFAADPQAYADKRVVTIGLGAFPAGENPKFMVRVADSYDGPHAITVDFSKSSAKLRKNLPEIDFPPHALLVAGVWRKTAEGWRLFADEIRDLGDTFGGSLSDALNGTDAAGIRAGQAGRLRRLDAELRRLKAETPRRYAENADLNARPQAYADKRVVAVGFGNFSSVENGAFSVRIADSYGGLPAITADFSGLSVAAKKTLLKADALPHVLLIAGLWRKTAGGWRLIADEARDFGEARCGPALSDCLKSPD